jgi:TolB-like protein/Flp pilus assembly protein TadD
VTDTLGPYELVRLIGRGGMGEVHLARDTRLERDVALKLLPADLADDPDRRARFLREARAAAALNHPNITTTLDIGEEGGRDYIAQEFLDGQPLSEIITERSLPLAELADLAVPLADALSFAHECGVIHRDLKAANVIVTSRGVPKLLDFGLAKILHDERVGESEQSTTLTLSGAIVGTPGAMSPEQALGKPLDARADVFSFGSLLYEIASGKPAFLGTTVQETLDKVLHAEAEPLARLRRDLPSDFIAIVEKALRKDPGQRYQSMAELVADLRHFKSQTDSGLRPPARQGPGMGRRLVAAVLVGGALIAALAWGLGAWRPGAAQASIAVLPFVNAGADPEIEYLADEIPCAVINRLSELSALRVVPRSTVFRLKGLDLDLAQVADQLEVRSALTGEIVRRGDRLTIRVELVDVPADKQLWGERFTVSTDGLVAIEEQIAREISDALHLRLSVDERSRLTSRQTEDAAAYRADLQGRFWLARRTTEGFAKAAASFESAIAHDPTYASAFVGLATTNILQGVYAEPMAECGPKARVAVDHALGLDPSRAEAHATLGLVKMFFEWDLEGARAAYAESIRLNPRYAPAHHWRAWALASQGHTDEAMVDLERALDLDPGSLIIRTDLGHLHGLAGHLDEARRRFREVLEMDPDFVKAYVYQGWMLTSEGRYQEALDQYQEVIDRVGVYPVMDGYRGMTFALMGHADEARRELEQLLQARSTRSVSPVAIARVYCALGELEPALEWLETARASRDGNMPLLCLEPWPGLRSQPRFRQLTEQIGLDPDWVPRRRAP